MQAALLIDWIHIPNQMPNVLWLRIRTFTFRKGNKFQMEFKKKITKYKEVFLRTATVVMLIFLWVLPSSTWENNKKTSTLLFLRLIFEPGLRKASSLGQKGKKKSKGKIKIFEGSFDTWNYQKFSTIILGKSAGRFSVLSFWWQVN